jgi:hypothetical protein
MNKEGVACLLTAAAIEQAADLVLERLPQQGFAAPGSNRGPSVTITCPASCRAVAGESR